MHAVVQVSKCGLFFASANSNVDVCTSCLCCLSTWRHWWSLGGYCWAAQVHWEDLGWIFKNFVLLLGILRPVRSQLVLSKDIFSGCATAGQYSRQSKGLLVASRKSTVVAWSGDTQVALCWKMLPPMTMLWKAHRSDNLSLLLFIAPIPWCPSPVQKLCCLIQVSHQYISVSYESQWRLQFVIEFIFDFIFAIIDWRIYL